MVVFSLAAFDQDTPVTTPPAPATDGTTATTGTSPDSPTQKAPSGMDSLMGLLPFLMIIVIFYFVMIGPERKQRKKREAMLAAVKKGDKVLTTGGMFASVAAVNEDSITLQASDDVRLKFSRQAIAQVLDDAAEASTKS